MSASFFFYDLETSGFNPREARIMQFGGQRTDLDLNPIGEPYSHYIKLSPDVLPDPDAVLLTGITPQYTIAEGLSEAEFLRIFQTKIATADTTFVGYNTVRFDDEFMRYLHYRNFYDAYEWHWKDGRSRWDLLDVVRMTRALRPDGIEWPFAPDGTPANRLELLTRLNKLDHANAHDALGDVKATIALARLLQLKQPKLFRYLLENRGKKQVADIVLTGKPFVYSSGKYPSEYQKTTVAIVLADHPKKTGALVYDLRHDPTLYFSLSAEQLAELWQHRCQERPCPHQRLPIKTLQFNRCPAVAPISVMDLASQKRLNLSLAKVRKHLKLLLANEEFPKRVLTALELMDQQQQARLINDEAEVDSRLYDGFVGDKDKLAMQAVRNASPDQLVSLDVSFEDDRLSALLPLYKARNYPKTLNNDERTIWEQFRERKLISGKGASRAARYFERLSQLAADKQLKDKKRYLLEELQLYGESVLPIVD